MTRGRAAGAVAVVVVLAAVVAAALLAPSGDAPRAARVTPAEEAYARTWEATCEALDLDARRTAADVRRRLDDRAPTSTTRRRLARRIVAPWLGRSDRRLRRLAGTTPPPRLLAYHRSAAARLTGAADRARDARDRARGGDLDGLDAVAATAGVGPRAPVELVRRTPACSASPGV